MQRLIYYFVLIASFANQSIVVAMSTDEAFVQNPWYTILSMGAFMLATAMLAWPIIFDPPMTVRQFGRHLVVMGGIPVASALAVCVGFGQPSGMLAYALGLYVIILMVLPFYVAFRGLNEFRVALRAAIKAEEEERAPLSTDNRTAMQIIAAAVSRTRRRNNNL